MLEPAAMAEVAPPELPAQQAPFQMPHIPEEFTYGQTEEFQGMLMQALEQGVDALPDAQKKQVKKAAEIIPTVGQALAESEQMRAAQEGEKDNPLQERLQPTIDALGKLAEVALSPNGETSGRHNKIDQAVVEMGIALKDLAARAYDEEGGIKDFFLEATGKTPSELLQDGFAKMGMDPIKKGEMMPVMGDDGMMTEKPIHEGQRIASNLALGAVRLAPELLVGMVENPVDFTAGLVQFPFEQLNTIAEAATGLSVDHTDDGFEVVRHTDAEVAAAAEEIKQNPIGVVMLALMGYGGFKAARRGRVTVETAKFDQALKDAAEHTKMMEEMRAAREKSKEDVPASEQRGTVKLEEYKEADKLEDPGKQKPSIPEEGVDVRAEIKKTPDGPLNSEIAQLRPDLKPGEIAKMDRATREAIVLAEEPPVAEAKSKTKKAEPKVQVDEAGKKDSPEAGEAKSAPKEITADEFSKRQESVTTLESSIAQTEKAASELGKIEGMEEAVRGLEKRLNEDRANLAAEQEALSNTKILEVEPEPPVEVKTGHEATDGARNAARLRKSIDATTEALESGRLPNNRRPKARQNLDKMKNQLAKLEEIKPLEERGMGLNLIPSTGGKLSREMGKAKRQRAAALSKDQPLFFVERAPNDATLLDKVRTPSNVFGAIPGQKPRFGEAAQGAMQDLLLGEFDMKVEVGRRGERMKEIFDGVPRAEWGKQGSKFYDHVVDPTRDGEMSSQGLKQAKGMRKMMEEDRAENVQILRDRQRSSVAKIVEREWRAENGMTGRRLTDKDKAQIEEAVETSLVERFPDDWGVKNYLPQMHPGSWQIMRRIDEKTNKQVGTASTPSQAIEVAMQDYAAHPELSPEAYTVQGKAFHGSDVTRVSDPLYWKTVSGIAREAEGLLTPDAVALGMRGQIGRAASRQKFAGFTKKRKGVEGYSKDLTRVMSVYNQSRTRWKYLGDLNRDVVPVIEQLRSSGRPNAAAILEGSFTHLWGKSQSSLSRGFDAGLQYIPGVRDVVKPQAIERWTGYLKTGLHYGLLEFNPRFHFLNSLQTYQTGMPLLSASEWASGSKFYRSKEGKAALEKHGVNYITKGKLGEAGRTLTGYNLRENMGRFAPETYNQRSMWARFYDQARNKGMGDRAAADYAFLRGNVESQFCHLTTDIPSALRGPVASTVFMYKRFPIKNLEMGINLLKDKNFPGAAKWAGAQLLFGGLKGATKPSLWLGGYLTAKAYKAISDEYGETIANTMYFGLPSLIGLDLSNSFGVIDEPYGESIPEKIGNMMMGPPGQITYRILRAARDTKGYEPSAWMRGLSAATQAIPALKSLEALGAIQNSADKGEYDFRDPAGRLKFTTDWKGLLVKSLGGRTVQEGVIDLLAEGMTDIQAIRDKVVDNTVMGIMQSLENNEMPDYSAVIDHNDLYPTAPIDTVTVLKRTNYRLERKDLDRLARLYLGLPKHLKANDLFLPQGE